MIEEKISLVDEILAAHTNHLGDDYLGYKNHVNRMIHFCFSQGDLSKEDRDKVIIAGCFHDLGIWTDDTFDYLPPSIALATEYLRSHGLKQWVPEITLMIDQHHKLGKYQNEQNSLVEVFRKGDLVDFSLGFVKCGLPKQIIKDVKKQFPNAGFHKGLVRVASRWFFKHPLNPIPVVKW